jgi:hypothetical protein
MEMKKENAMKKTQQREVKAQVVGALAHFQA